MSLSCLPNKDKLTEAFKEYLEDEGLVIVPRRKDPAEADWSRLAKAMNGLFRRKKLKHGELEALHNTVKRIVKSQKGQFLFNWCKNKVFKEGVDILRDSINGKKDPDVLAEIEEVWIYFYGEILPTIQAIFCVSELTAREEDLSTSPKKSTVRQLVLLAFRNGIALQFNLQDLITATSVTPTLKQMLLVLQSAPDYEASEKNDALEVLVAQAVIPYLGFRGYYTGSRVPVIESSEPELASQRRSSAENRRLSRPLSVQPNPINTLAKMLRTAAARTSSLSEA